ncbi:ABC transporter substrate-binding protein [Salipiger abyssi]|uniref:ABC transporter substrate-binding protein n=1 Tax=Salipiger abyssi TaxID=1250539 RepID=UPI0040580796
MTRKDNGAGSDLTRDQIETARRALRGGMTRRQMIGYMLATSAAAGTAPALLGLDGQAFAQETPKTGGRLRVAANTGSTADTLDPALVRKSTDYVRIRMFFNTLTVMDETMTPQMDLAESITSEDVTTWVIKLKPGIEFHDGKTLTAEDVAYSLSRHNDPDLSSRAASLTKQFASVTVTAPLEVTIVLDAPNADVPALLTGHNFAIVQDGATDFLKPVGTGPFTCEVFEPGGRAVGKRFGNYFKDGKPYLDEIEHFAIADDNARINALMSGDVDFVAGIKPVASRVIEANPMTELLITNAGNYTDFIIRVDQEPGNSPDFVLGMKYLMNRQQMLDAALRGFGLVANDTPLAPSSKYYNADIPQRPYDPEQAKAHFEKAGVMGKSVEMVTSDAAGISVELGIILQESARSIGFDLTINKVPSDGYWSNYWFKVPLSWGNILPRPTPDILFSQFYQSTAAWNESGWSNERFDTLLLEARKEMDEGLRKDMYGEMQQLIHDHCGVLIPTFQANMDGYRTGVKGLKPMPTGPMMGYDFAESVWKDA